MTFFLLSFLLHVSSFVTGLRGNNKISSFVIDYQTSVTMAAERVFLNIIGQLYTAPSSAHGKQLNACVVDNQMVDILHTYFFL